MHWKAGSPTINTKTSAIWQRPEWSGTRDALDFGLSSSSSSSASSDTESVASLKGTTEGWSDQEEEQEDDDHDNEEDEDDGREEGSSEGSWGSGGGDYRAHGQGKLVSDAEFFQYCGSPERAR